MMLEGLREFNSYGNRDAVSINSQRPTPNSQARRTFGAWRLGMGVESWAFWELRAPQPVKPSPVRRISRRNHSCFS
jgi:hypothetical protein